MAFHLILAALFVLLSPQDSAQPAPASVSGRVVWQGIGAGIRKVVVTLHPESAAGQPLAELSTSTDSEGRFRIEAIPAGNYSVTLRRAGFTLADKNPGQTEITLTAGQDLSSLVYNMEATGIIAGKITESDGDPLPGISVWVTRTGKTSNSAATSENVNDAGQETTNDLGEFRIANLHAGQYIVQAQAHGQNPTPDPADKGRQKDPATYALTFFPGTADSKTATPVQVTPGGTAAANFTLLVSRSFHVGGTVTVAGNPHNFQMYLVSTTGQTEAQSLGDGGKFEFSNILPGTYVAQVVDMSAPSDGRPTETHTQMIGSPIVVSNSDVSGLVLQPEAGGSVSGRVHTEEGDPLDWKQFNVSLVRVPSEDELPQFSNIGALGGNAYLREDGTFEMKDVAGATYWVVFGGQASSIGDYYLKSVSVDGRDVTGTGFPVNGPTSVDITLGSNGAAIDGSVVDQNGQGVSGVEVVTLPVSGKAGRLDLYNLEKTDSSGHFAMRGLTPGTYVLVALDNLPDNFRTQEFYKQYADKGENVDLAEGDKRSVVVKMSEDKE